MVEIFKEVLIAPILAFTVLGLWEYKFERKAKRALRKYLDKKAEESKGVFIDPR